MTRERMRMLYKSISVEWKGDLKTYAGDKKASFPKSLTRYGVVYFPNLQREKTARFFTVEIGDNSN